MNKLLSCMFIALFIFCTSVITQALPLNVEILSTSYSISLRYNCLDDYAVVCYDSFQQTSPDPLAHELLMEDYPGAIYAKAATNEFSVYTAASNPGGAAGAFAEASWLFSPIDSSGGLYLLSQTESFSRTEISIFDETEDVLIFSRSFNVWSDGWQPVTIPINYYFNETHIYGMNMFASSGASYDRSDPAYLSVAGMHSVNYPAPVPEPATMLLFGTGLTGLVGSRIRKKK